MTTNERVIRFLKQAVKEIVWEQRALEDRAAKLRVAIQVQENWHDS